MSERDNHDGLKVSAADWLLLLLALLLAIGVIVVGGRSNKQIRDLQQRVGELEQQVRR